MKFDGHDTYVLSSGRTISAHLGLLSVSGDQRHADTLGEGFDGMVDNAYDPIDDDNDGPLTPAERLEIADYMIEQWRRWASMGHLRTPGAAPEPGAPFEAEGRRRDEVTGPGGEPDPVV